MRLIDHPFLKSFMFILSGVLCALSFAVPELSLLMWVALVPLILALRELNHQGTYRFRYGFLFGLTYYTILLSWLWALYPLDWLGFDAAQGMPLMMLMWLVLSGIEAFGLAVICYLFSKIKTSATGQIFALAFLWVILEFCQGQTALGFTWGRLGLSQYPTPLLIQSASLFGSLFITFSIVLVNGCLSLLLDKCRPARLQRKTAVLLLLFSAFSLGFDLIHFYRPSEATETIKAAVIQGNISAYDKWSDDHQQAVLSTYLTLSHAALAHEPDLLFWPETAVPVDLDESPETGLAYQRLAIEGQLHFLFGSFTAEGSERYNAVMTINPKGQILPEPYYKQHLVPFGEYVPFKDFFTAVAPDFLDINRLDEDLSHGDTARILELPQGKIGALICFDSIFPELARQSVMQGAEAIFIATNDSWYQRTPAISQHLGQAIFRAVENHRSIIRAANTGISAIIGPTGQIIAVRPELTDGYLVSSLPLHRKTTLYARTGDIIVPAGIGYLIFILLRQRKK